MRQIAHADTETETQSEETTDEAVQQCPECGGRLVTADDGERFCDECGIVVDDEQIDRGPEWRAYSHEEYENKARTGAPTAQNIHDKGLSTVIDWRDKDANGNALSTQKKRKMRRLRQWDEHARTKDSKERNLKKALSEINRMTSALGLPDSVNQTASVVYRRAVDEDLLVGRSIEGVATAALYCACRQERVPRTLEQFGSVSRIDRMKVSSAYRYLSNELNLELPPADPREFIPGVASKLDIPHIVETEAENIVKAYAEAGEHSGRHTKGVAAASLYTANKLLDERTTLTQKDAADAGDVCVVTIRSRHEELVAYEDAVETDPSELSTGADATGGDEAEETEPAPDYPEIDADGIELTEVEDGTHVVYVPESATQNEVLIEAVETLATEHGLIEAVGAPYSPGSWHNDFIVNDPEEEAAEQAASWAELATGHHVNTKIDKGQKERVMKMVAEQVGITLRFDGDW